MTIIPRAVARAIVNMKDGELCNNSEQLNAVKYFCKALYFRCLYGSWLRLLSQWSLREKCSYSVLFWYALPRIWIEYGEIFRISLYSARMRKNVDQNNWECGLFLRSGWEVLMSLFFLRLLRNSLNSLFVSIKFCLVW